MEDALLAWRNIWRNPRRSTLTVLAIVFATALLVFMLSFQLGTYEDMIDSSVQRTTGHLQIQAKGYNERQEMWLVIPKPETLLPLIREQPGISGFGIRSETFALAAGATRSRGASIIGVDPTNEQALSSIPGQIREGRYLQAGDTGVAIMGSLCAERLKIKTGDECTLLGQGRDGSVGAAIVRIIGIFHSGIDEFDRSTVLMPRTDFDDVFYMDQSAHRIILTVEHLKDVAPIAAALKTAPELAELTLLTWDELNPGLRQSIELDLIGGIIMYAILIIVVSFSILNTFFMAIFERTREFGVLLSIGTKPTRLVKLMLMESMAMTGLGLLGGTVAGVVLTLFFAHHGISFGDSGELLAQYGISERLYPQLSLISVFTGPLIIFVATFITALIPALKIPRLSPVEALRGN